MENKETELHLQAVSYIVGKLSDMGYSISRLSNSCPFTVYAEFGNYSFVADIKYRDRAWALFIVPTKLVKDYSNYNTIAKDKILIFHTLTKRNPDFFIRTDDIQRLGYLTGPNYAIEAQYTSTLAVLRKLLEASME